MKSERRFFLPDGREVFRLPNHVLMARFALRPILATATPFTRPSTLDRQAERTQHLRRLQPIRSHKAAIAGKATPPPLLEHLPRRPTDPPTQRPSRERSPLPTTACLLADLQSVEYVSLSSSTGVGACTEPATGRIQQRDSRTSAAKSTNQSPPSLRIFWSHADA